MPFRCACVLSSIDRAYALDRACSSVGLLLHMATAQPWRIVDAKLFARVLLSMPESLTEARAVDA